MTRRRIAIAPLLLMTAQVPACAADPDAPDFRSADAGAGSAAITQAVVSCTEQPENRIRGDGAPLVSMSACGKLAYGRYSNRGENNNNGIIPDFSHAGYRGGGVALPDVPVRQTVSPGSGDDTARIQAAIDAVANLAADASGRRGAVLLRRGRYGVANTLRIRASGVVLRGEGQGTSGTVLVATRREQYTLIDVAGSGSGLGEVSGSRVKITTGFVPVGARSFAVSSTAGLAVGTQVGVLRTPNQRWIDDLGMGQWGWTPSSYAIAAERRIVAISGNTVTVNLPIVDTIETKYGGGSLFRSNLSGRISEVGVENLRTESEYSGSSTDENHAWTAVRLSRVTNGWIRGVTAVHFGSSLASLDNNSSFNTVQDSAMVDPISQIEGGRRYSFAINGGTGNLIQRAYSRGGRHSVVTGARVTGPHVFLDVLEARTESDSGPHHRWATGLLFDNVQAGMLAVENRKDAGSGHGWSGAQTLFWNNRGTGIRCDAPVGAMNWAIGVAAPRAEGYKAPEEWFGWFESDGTAVQPRSLYLRQLEDRLGRAAVEAVTLPAQRVGTIWAELAAWAGEGAFLPSIADEGCDDGVLSADGNICCAASCGTCGGSGCTRPGGASQCCTSAIGSSGRSCTTHPPPCVMP